MWWGRCECGNELPGSIKWGEFLDWLKTCYFLRKDSAQLVSYLEEGCSKYIRHVRQCMSVCTASFPESAVTVLSSPQPPDRLKCVTKGVSLELMRQRSEADHTPIHSP
jgi:hypothetical protein